MRADAAVGNRLTGDRLAVRQRARQTGSIRGYRKYEPAWRVEFCRGVPPALTLALFAAYQDRLGMVPLLLERRQQ